MESELEPDIRNLAYHLWQTAGREFGQTALDFWAMAERMVVEMTVDSIRRANTATATAVENAAVWPSALRALYRYRVRELARDMWAATPNGVIAPWISGWPPSSTCACWRNRRRAPPPPPSGARKP